MQPFSQKYAIIQPFEPLTIGDEFSSGDWPLHTTIADTFTVDWTDELWRDITAYVAGIQPFDVSAGDDAYFGAHGETTVTLLHPTPEIQHLHDSVVDVLSAADAIFNNPEYTHQGFKPHATVQRHARLVYNDVVKFTSLYVIDMFPDSNPYQRKVIQSLPLTQNK